MTSKQDFVTVLETQSKFYQQTADNALEILGNQATVSKRQLLNYVEATRGNSQRFVDLNTGLINNLREEINGEKDQDRA